MAGAAGSRQVGVSGSAGAGGSDELAGTAGNQLAGAAGSDSLVASAGVAGKLFINPATPIVTITSPKAPADPNDAANVLIRKDSLVDVTCKAEAANVPGSTVNVGTTKVTIPGQGDAAAIEPAKTTPTVDGVTAQFSLKSLPSGPVTFQCKAQDNSSLALTGYSEPLSTYLDHGPGLSIVQPKDGDPWAQKNPVKIIFNVAPVKLSDKDLMADATTVSLMVDDRTIPVTETVLGSGTYSATVSFTDTEVFPANATPNGPTIIKALAVNKRGAESESSITINVDSTPPVVSDITPADGEVVGGDIHLGFFAIDPVTPGTTKAGTGIDVSKIIVKINTESFPYDASSARWQYSEAKGQFSFTFRESDIGNSVAQATVQIIATDKAGNTSPAASLLLYLDNAPPLVDLDPPTIREIYGDSTAPGGKRASNAFDPLGEAVNDRAVSNGAGIFRALVWERTNIPRSGALHYAGIDNSSVRLWMQPLVTQPLLADRDGDGYCDTIDQGTTESPAEFLNLTALAPSGQSPRLPASTSTAFDDMRFWDPPSNGGFEGPGVSATSPDHLCQKNSDMVRVTQHNILSTSATPVVYVRASTSVVECTGSTWEYGAFLGHRTVPDGWVCLAAEATDTKGNRGVSQVMALCYDDPSTPTVPSCATNIMPPKSDKAPPWVSTVPQVPPRSAETPTCVVNCKMQKIDPVSYVYLN